jgi:hypothetical protein
VIAAHHLESMERGEIGPYILHRLQRVGWEGNPQFDQRVFSELFEASGGIPRRINQIANRLLLLGAIEQRSRIDSAMLKAVLEEMAEEKAFPHAAPKPHAPEPVAASPAKAPETDQQAFEQLLAERDAQIAELQEAVIELAGRQDAAAHPQIAVLHEQLARLDAKALEQERTIRRTLTMLIEWIEGEMDQSRAA